MFLEAVSCSFPVLIVPTRTGESMDWEMAHKRQALAEWRDRQILELCRVLNLHAQQARTAFEAELQDAGLIDSVWDPARFAHARIDRLLGETVPQALRQFLTQAANELSATDGSFVPFANALRESRGIAFPRELVEQSSGRGASVTADTKIPEEVDHVHDGNRIHRLAGQARAFGGKAASVIVKAGKRAGTTFQDRSGLHGRLRSAAADRVATQWMGGRGEPRPILAQVISIIDDVAAEARMSTI